jgi:hypothetical protein
MNLNLFKLNIMVMLKHFLIFHPMFLPIISSTLYVLLPHPLYVLPIVSLALYVVLPIVSLALYVEKQQNYKTLVILFSWKNLPWQKDNLYQKFYL